MHLSSFLLRAACCLVWGGALHAGQTVFKLVNETGHLLNVMDVTPPAPGASGRMILAADWGLRRPLFFQPGFMGALEPMATLNLTLEAEPGQLPPTLSLVPAGGPMGVPMGLPSIVLHLGPLEAPGTETSPERMIILKPMASGLHPAFGLVGPQPLGPSCSFLPLFQPPPPPGPPSCPSIPSGASQPSPLPAPGGTGGGTDRPAATSEPDRPARGTKRPSPEPAQGGGGPAPSTTETLEGKGEERMGNSSKVPKKQRFEFRNSSSAWIFSVNNRSGQDWRLVNLDPAVSPKVKSEIRPQVEIRTLSGDLVGNYETFCKPGLSRGVYPIPAGMTVRFLVLRQRQNFKSTGKSKFPLILQDHRHTSPSGTHFLISSKLVEGISKSNPATWYVQPIGLPEADDASSDGPVRIVGQDTLEIIQADWGKSSGEGARDTAASMPGSSGSSSSSSADWMPPSTSSVQLSSLPPPLAPSAPRQPCHGGPGAFRNGSQGAWSLETEELTAACVVKKRLATGLVCRNSLTKGQAATITLPAGAEVTVKVLEEEGEAVFRLQDATGPHASGFGISFTENEINPFRAEESKEEDSGLLRAMVLPDGNGGFTIAVDHWGAACNLPES